MATRDKVPASGDACVVAAAIIHQTGRVLAIQRAGSDLWELPCELLSGDEAGMSNLRATVRAATGFDVACTSVVGQYGTSTGPVEVVRCEIRGVGGEITSSTQKMRWLDREAVPEHMPDPYARAMIDVLDDLQTLDVSLPGPGAPPELLAS